MQYVYTQSFRFKPIGIIRIALGALSSRSIFRSSHSLSGLSIRPHFAMAVHVVGNLEQLRASMTNAPTTKSGDQHWWSVRLTELSMIENLRGSDRGCDAWAALQVKCIVINGQHIHIADTLDAHISLGTWTIIDKHTSDMWDRQFRNACRKLTDTASIDMVLYPNEPQCTDIVHYFKFMVHSAGGQTLHRLKQTLDASGLECRLDRGISRVGTSTGIHGLVFHLSVYDELLRWRHGPRWRYGPR